MASIKNEKNTRLAVICLGLVLVVGFIFLSRGPEPIHGKCGPYSKDKTVSINGVKLDAEVAQTQTALSKGLSNRPCIEPNQVMLFIFSRPDRQAIWMKDMKFPIDILWISADKKVVGIERDVKPSTYPDSFVNKDHPALYVLELKANRSSELNIKLGETISF